MVQVPPGMNHANVCQSSYLNLDVTLSQPPNGALQVRLESEYNVSTVVGVLCILCKSSINMVASSS